LARFFKPDIAPGACVRPRQSGHTAGRATAAQKARQQHPFV